MPVESQGWIREPSSHRPPFVPQINRNIRFATYTKENGPGLWWCRMSLWVGTHLYLSLRILQPQVRHLWPQRSVEPKIKRQEKHALEQVGQCMVASAAVVTTPAPTPTTVRISDTGLATGTGLGEKQKGSWSQAPGEVSCFRGRFARCGFTLSPYFVLSTLKSISDAIGKNYFWDVFKLYSVGSPLLLVGQMCIFLKLSQLLKSPEQLG